MATPAATTKAKNAPRVAPVITPISAALTMPERASNRGSKTIYPFEQLQVGQSFGVKNKKAENMTSIISNQNRKTYPVKDASGAIVMKPIKDAAGAVIGQSADPETFSKRFFAVDVDAKKDPDGATVRVWREQ
jgi:hypothetical protein